MTSGHLISILVSPIQFKLIFLNLMLCYVLSSDNNSLGAVSTRRSRPSCPTHRTCLCNIPGSYHRVWSSFIQFWLVLTFYRFGGTDGQYHYNDTWSYDTNTRTWSELQCIGFIPSPREGHAAAVVDDVIYIFGGRGVDGKDLGDLAAFKMSST
jgi:hypothetical protein